MCFDTRKQERVIHKPTTQGATINKKQKKARAQEIIDIYSLEQPFSPEHVAEFSELCGYRFEHIKRKDHNFGGTRSIWVSCTDEQHEGFWSWLKSIDGYDKRKNMLQACRMATRDGSFGKVIKTKCEFCDTTDQLTVDHKSTSFSKIVADYLRQFGEPSLANTSAGWVLAADDHRQFLRYHDDRADYQVLCVSCNSSKGSRSIS